MSPGLPRELPAARLTGYSLEIACRGFQAHYSYFSSVFEPDRTLCHAEDSVGSESTSLPQPQLRLLGLHGTARALPQEPPTHQEPRCA